MNAVFHDRALSWLKGKAGQELDFDGYYGAQCVDLAQFYNREVVGGTRFWGNAADIWGQDGGGKYRMIQNTPDFVPQLGDIVIWNTNMGGGYGHIAIATGVGTTATFESLDQNWSRPAASYVTHNYDNLLGFMRPVASEETVEDRYPTPPAENVGIVNGEGLRAHTEPNTTSAWPWYFDDTEQIQLYSRRKGENVTTGPYAPSAWWYEVRPYGEDGGALWVSDAFIRTKSTPADVPLYVVTTKPPTTEYTPLPDNGMSVVDVSSYQGDVDWLQVKEYGIQGAIIRAGHVGPMEVGGDNRQDEKLTENRNAARLAGLACGFYWYIFLSDDPVTEAGRMYRAIGPLKDGESLWLDLEDKPDEGYDLNAFVGAFLDELEQLTGRYAHAYSYSSYLAAYDFKTAMAFHRERALWVANYNGTPGVFPTPEGYPAPVMHQYTSSGRIPGIKGNVDLNLFMGSLADFLALDIRFPLSPPQEVPGDPGTTPPPASGGGGRLWQAFKRFAQWLGNIFGRPNKS